MKLKLFGAGLVLLFSLQVWAASPLGIFGDGGVLSSKTHQLRETMKRERVTNLILLGDNIYDTSSSYAQIWDPWKQAGFTFKAVAIGNHNKGHHDEIAFFRMPAEAYSVVEQGVRFVVLNSDNESSAAAQISFLESVLKNAKEPQVYLILHHPFVTVSPRHKWQERAKFQVPFRNLVKKYNSRITGILSGHDHVAAVVDVDGLPLLISGAVFESFPAPALNYNDGLFQIRSRWSYRGGYYWIRMTMLQGETWAEYRRADRSETSCSVRLYPKPYQTRANCQ